MKQKYGKKYFEKYAQLTLEYCYKEIYKGLDLLDEPDLQSNESSVGIEVVRAMAKPLKKGKSSIEGNLYDIKKNYFGRNLTFDEMKAEIKKEYPKYIKYLKEKNGYICINDPNRDILYYIKNIVYAIKIKTKKLNSGNYKIFDNNYLYIFSSSSVLNEADIRTILSLEAKVTSKFVLKYDVYFINCHHKLYIIDRKNIAINKIEINEAMLKKIDETAIAYYESILTNSKNFI